MDGVVDLAAIERRIAAVSSVRQVVSAIWALARAQLPLIEQASAEASAYLQWVDEVVERVAGAPGEGRGGPSLTVVLGPERPYCGALPRSVAEQLPPEGELGIVGRRLAEALEFDRAVQQRVRFSVSGPATHDDAETVARAVAEEVLALAPGRAVTVLCPRLGARGLQRVTLLGGERSSVGIVPETLSPVAEVLAASVHEAASSWLTVLLMQSLLVEVRARVVAAEAARVACDRQLEEIRGAWRVARQEAITSEILEVVSGTSATR